MFYNKMNDMREVKAKNKATDICKVMCLKLISSSDQCRSGLQDNQATCNTAQYLRLWKQLMH